MSKELIAFIGPGTSTETYQGRSAADFATDPANDGNIGTSEVSKSIITKIALGADYATGVLERDTEGKWTVNEKPEIPPTADGKVKTPKAVERVIAIVPTGESVIAPADLKAAIVAHDPYNVDPSKLLILVLSTDVVGTISRHLLDKFWAADPDCFPRAKVKDGVVEQNFIPAKWEIIVEDDSPGGSTSSGEVTPERKAELNRRIKAQFTNQVHQATPGPLNLGSGSPPGPGYSLTQPHIQRHGADQLPSNPRNRSIAPSSAPSKAATVEDITAAIAGGGSGGQTDQQKLFSTTFGGPEEFYPRGAVAHDCLQLHRTGGIGGEADPDLTTGMRTVHKLPDDPAEEVADCVHSLLRRVETHGRLLENKILNHEPIPDIVGKYWSLDGLTSAEKTKLKQYCNFLCLLDFGFKTFATARPQVVNGSVTKEMLKEYLKGLYQKAFGSPQAEDKAIQREAEKHVQDLLGKNPQAQGTQPQTSDVFNLIPLSCRHPG